MDATRRTRERLVRGVGRTRADDLAPPAVPLPDEPCVTAKGFGSREIFGAIGFPESAAAAKCRHARLRADSRAREHDDALGAGDEIARFFDHGRRLRVDFFFAAAFLSTAFFVARLTGFRFVFAARFARATSIDFSTHGRSSFTSSRIPSSSSVVLHGLALITERAKRPEPSRLEVAAIRIADFEIERVTVDQREEQIAGIDADAAEHRARTHLRRDPRQLIEHERAKGFVDGHGCER